MRKLALGAALALGVLAGCGSAASHPPAQAAGAVASIQAAPPTSPAPTSNSYACWAFHQATTKGVPASGAGQTTLGWLQGQVTNATVAMQAAVTRYVNAWSFADPGKINRAGAAIKRLCKGA